MRILFITHEDLGEQGGPRVHAQALVAGLIRAGNSVSVAAPMSQAWRAPGNTVNLNQTSYRSRWVLVSCWHLALTFLNMIRFLRRNHKEFDIIYCRDHFAGVIASLFLVRSHCKIIREVNGYPAEEGQSAEKSLISRFFSKIVGWADGYSFHHSDFTIFVAPALQKKFLERFGEPSSRYAVERNGVDLERFSESAKLRDLRTEWQAEHKMIIMLVASLTYRNNIETLLQAAQILNLQSMHFLVVIVGNGPKYDSLLELTAALNLNDCVRFTGSVDIEMSPHLLYNADICVACHRAGALGSALKTNEYLAAGKAIIQSAIEDTEYLEEFKIGLRYTPSDASDLASKIRQLSNPTLRAQLGRNARNYAVQNLSWHCITERIGSHCEKLMQR